MNLPATLKKHFFIWSAVGPKPVDPHSPRGIDEPFHDLSELWSGLIVVKTLKVFRMDYRERKERRIAQHDFGPNRENGRCPWTDKPKGIAQGN